MQRIPTCIKLYNVNQIRNLKNYNEFELLDDYFKQRNEEYFNDISKKFLFFVMETSNKPIGLIGLEFNRKYNVCYISPLEVLKKYRNMGRGRELLQKAKNFITPNGMYNWNIQYNTRCDVKTVYLKCETKKLVGYYIRNGFEIDSKYTNKENGIVMSCKNRF